MDQKNTYKDKMEQVWPPAYLKSRAINKIRMISTEQSLDWTEKLHELEVKNEQCALGNPQDKAHRNKRTCFALLSAAAVLLLAVIVPSLLINPGGASNSLDSTKDHVPASSPFIISAYAVTPDFESTEFDELIVFGSMGGQSIDSSFADTIGDNDSFASNTSGSFTDCLFRIEGEGVTRVEFECSAAQIYCNAVVMYGSLGTGPINSNSSDHRGAYKSLRKKLGGSFVEMSSSISMPSAGSEYPSFGHISGNRLLGSNPTIETALAGGTFDLNDLAFGLYVSAEDMIWDSGYEDDYFTLDERNFFSMHERMSTFNSTDLMASLEGQTLKVQIYYDDGTSITQTYRLVVKKMKVQLPPLFSIDFDAGSVTTGSYLPEEAEEGDPFVYVLFGEVV